MAIVFVGVDPAKKVFALPWRGRGGQGGAGARDGGARL